ncbi:MAG: hypothetical protein V4517_18820 [Pseudomonadota bacterium]
MGPNLGIYRQRLWNGCELDPQRRPRSGSNRHIQFGGGSSADRQPRLHDRHRESDRGRPGLPERTTRQQFEDRYTEYPFNPVGHGAELISNYAKADGFVEVAEAPTGFMCIKRDVFRQMMESYPALNYVPDGPPHPEAHLYWLFFDCMVDPDSGRYLSEDFAFCRRWRDIGGKIWVDLECKLLHLGQHNFRGDLAESMRWQGRW